MAVASPQDRPCNVRLELNGVRSKKTDPPHKHDPEEDRIHGYIINIEDHTELQATDTHLQATQQVQQTVSKEGGGEAVPHQ